jgi:glutamate racemase
MSDTRPIGVFDSGVGGLTVVREIIKRLPNEHIVYFGDTARVPYGTKSARVVEKFALQDIHFLLGQNVKLLIAACHTVSSVVLDELISRLHLPLLGVVEPGVKAAVEVTQNGCIGVIGTRATILSGSYERKILELQKDLTVVSNPCPLFVPLAEEGWLDQEVTRRTAEIYLAPFKDQGIDTLILGCTHYPLLKPVIRDELDGHVTIIDSAEETAKLVAKRLHLLRMENNQKSSVQRQYYVSDIPHLFKEVGERFLGMGLGHVDRVDLDSLYFEEIPRLSKT